MSLPHRLTATAVADRVSALHPMPPLLYEVIALTEESPDAAQELSAMARSDGDLCDRIERSPLSCRLPRPHADDSATLVDGMTYRELHSSAVLGLVLRALPDQTRSFDRDTYWRHATACAVLATALAEDEASDASDLAFLAGMLNEIGAWVADFVSPAAVAEFRQALLEREWSEALEDSSFGFTLREVSAAIIGAWRLPAPVLEAHLVRFERNLWETRPLAQILWDARMTLQAQGVYHVIRGSRPPAPVSAPARLTLRARFGSVESLLGHAELLRQHYLPSQN